MIIRRSLFGLYFASFLAAMSANGLAMDQAAPESGGSCARATSGEPTSAVNIPDYSANVDSTVDPKQAAAQAEWQRYQESVFESLSHSPDPRDWALATVTGFLKFDLNDPDQDGRVQTSELLERATRAVPDDALVQWIAVRQSSKADTLVAAGEALQRLQLLEPDNAAVWLEVLTGAAQQKDETAIDATLSKMSASSRFDNHFAQLMKAVTDVYLRYPAPDVYSTLAGEQEKPFPKESIPYVNAMAVAAALAFPAFQHAVNACRVNQVSGKNASRSADCAATGRLMAAHGDSLLANRMGFVLLRVSHTFNDEDMRAARNDDWIYARYLETVSDRDGEESPEEIIAYQKDWIESGSEMEAMRHQLARAGTPLAPPDDWPDDHSLFSAERLRTDEEYFKKEAPTH